MQRVALPQASTSPPSGFQIRIQVSPWPRGGSMTAADAKLAVGQQTDSSFAQRKRLRAGIENDKIIAQPVHFHERPRLM